MELLIENFHEHRIFFSKEDEPPNISKWKGLQWNQHEEIIGINWNWAWVSGNIDLKWLPSSVQRCCLVNGRFTAPYLHGTIDTPDLPADLIELDLHEHRFDGTIDLSSLSRKMEVLDLSKNSLQGSLALDCLPSSFQRLKLQGNFFTGSMSLESLPKALKILQLSSNRLSGVVDLRHLPDSLMSLYLNLNDFEGKTDFSNLPKSLGVLSVSDTLLSGTVISQKGQQIFSSQSGVSVIKLE